MAAIVYSTPERNELFSMPVSIISPSRAAPAGQRGAFGLGADGVLAAAYEEAGFREVEVRKLPVPLRLSSAAECVRFERESFGALQCPLVGTALPAPKAN